MAAKFTPGKWEIRFGAMEGETYFTIASCMTNYVGVVCEYSVPAPRPSAEVIANARLITQSPALYAACEAVMRAFSEDPGPSAPSIAAMSLVRDALAACE